MQQGKAADVLAATGALVPGLGLGVLVSRWIAPAGVFLVLGGAALHARGMMVKHRLEAMAVVPKWWVWLYWLCWAGLLVVGALVLVDGIW